MVGCLGGSDGKESSCYAGHLGWKDPQEKGKAIHSSLFAWRIPWTEEYGGLQLMDMTEQLTYSILPLAM